MGDACQDCMHRKAEKANRARRRADSVFLSGQAAARSGQLFRQNDFGRACSVRRAQRRQLFLHSVRTFGRMPVRQAAHGNRRKRVEMTERNTRRFKGNGRPWLFAGGRAEGLIKRYRRAGFDTGSFSFGKVGIAFQEAS